MITIINVGGNPSGVCSYLLRINHKVMCEFAHDRNKGLSECLRAAADAYDRVKESDND